MHCKRKNMIPFLYLALQPQNVMLPNTVDKDLTYIVTKDNDQGKNANN